MPSDGLVQPCVPKMANTATSNHPKNRLEVVRMRRDSGPDQGCLHLVAPDITHQHPDQRKGEIHRRTRAS